MAEKLIEHAIREVLTGDEQQYAFEFAGYLRANEMEFIRGGGYWADKLYWLVKCRDEYVCFILINGAEDKTEPEGLTIWSDDSDSKWFEDFPLDEALKESGWKSVDFCGNCGGSCASGAVKTIFGRKFEHVCRTTFRSTHPDAGTLAFFIKMVQIRKSEILGKY